jgi:hypothetical protein
MSRSGIRHRRQHHPAGRPGLERQFRRKPDPLVRHAVRQPRADHRRRVHLRYRNDPGRNRCHAQLRRVVERDRRLQPVHGLVLRIVEEDRPDRREPDAQTPREQWRPDDDFGLAPVQPRRQLRRPAGQLVLPGCRPAGRVPPVGTCLRYRRLRTALQALSRAAAAGENGRGGGGVSVRARFGRSGTMGEDRVDTGRGPSMYEMEGPRPASRRRPADFSASLRRSTTYQGQERSQRSGRPDHRVARGLPAPVAQAFLFTDKPGVSPKPGGAEYFLSQWLRAFFSPNDRGFPQAKRLKFSLCRVAQSFLLITRLGVSPPPRNLKPSLRRVAQGFLLITRLGVSPPPRNLKFSLRRVAQSFLLRT